MTTPSAVPHVRIDPRFGFSCLTPAHNPERDMFARIAQEGRDAEALAIMDRAVRACRQHIENRQVAMLLRGGWDIREQNV